MDRCEHYDFSCKQEELTCKGCAYANADELFDEAGYIKIQHDVYQEKVSPYNNIFFEDKLVKLRHKKDLTSKEIKAICKKMEELRW